MSDRTSEELRIEANDDEEVARTSVGLARVAWAAAAVVKRDLADALDEIARLQATLAAWRAKTDEFDERGHTCDSALPHRACKVCDLIITLRALCDGPEGGCHE